MVKINKESITCEISDVTLRDCKLPPLLVSFQHGVLVPEESGSLTCLVSHNKSTQKRHVAVSTRDNHVYVGSGDTLVDDSNASDICNTFIAIRNRKTNKIRLIEADNILLSPHITKQGSLIKSNVTVIPSYDDKYGNLQRSFGSKRSKRLTDQYQRYKKDVNSLEEKLLEVVDMVDSKHLEQEEAVSSSCPFIPLCNRKAKVVEDVYNLQDIISKRELDSMEDEAVKVIENFTVLNISDFTPFFMENLPQVLESKKEVLERVKALLYADCILKFFKGPYKGDKSLKSSCTFSKVIVSKISQEFTMESNSKNRLRPLSMRDKALCHVMILGLLTLNFKLNLKTVSESVKISQQRLTEFCRAIGATYKKGEEVINLKLPLPQLPSSLLNSKKKPRKK